MTKHEKLMLARHLERAARAYEEDLKNSSLDPSEIQGYASEARTYAALLRTGDKDTVLPRWGAL